MTAGYIGWEFAEPPSRPVEPPSQENQSAVQAIIADMLEGWYCRTMNEEAQRKSPLMTMIEATQPNPLMSLMNDEAPHMTPMISMMNEEQQQPSTSMLALLNEEPPTSTPQRNPMPTAVPEQPTMDVSSSVEDDTDEDESGTFDIDYKEMYTDLKKKMKILINENIYFKHSLRSHHKRLLKIIRDRSFLLDRLLKYQQPPASSSDSDETVESDDSIRVVEPQPKKRKVEPSTSQSSVSAMKPPAMEMQQLQQHILFQPSTFAQQPATSSAYQFPLSMMSQVPTELLANTSYTELDVSPGDDSAMESQMTKEELERHLQSRQTMPQVIPEGELPIEMFSNNSSTEASDQL
uniref:INO80 complex subunit E N-terminal domain-containing protein n=1 Tax=Anopheles stephensi TaxID=30069 RepID=A0A182Y506_ANOST